MEARASDVRIDKWLWAARFFKTRGLAVEAIDAGHVRRAGGGGMIGDRVKPSLIVKRDDSFAIRRNDLEYVIVVAELSERRGSASDAASQSILRGRPTKQDRRRLADFFASNYRDSTAQE
jgi:ribosome-associated heat shock protein Hsp15